ncbi:MAG: ABC transporter ATP-binding protein [Rhodospirillales bacterium]|jgi:sn-glycerol 3-phosphate transport system ATP-binding protein
MADVLIAGVRKSFARTEVVRGVDLAIPSGEFVVVLGPSGCGKSTLLRMIAGLEEITAGEIAIGGEVVNDLEPRARGCAMVFQNYALYPHMTVAENIGYALKVAGLPRAQRAERVRDIARTVGLEEFLDRRPAQLSGGQRQRVAMGRAMIRSPKLFLFDEPLSNLDAKLRVQMRIEIRKLHNRLRSTSIFVTHDQIEAMTLADRLVVMNQGVIEQVGTPAEVYRAPATRFVAGFIGTPPMNMLEGEATGPGSVATAGLRWSLDRSDLEAGQRVVVGIRPEHCVPAAGASPVNVFDIDVDFREELGAARLLHGRAGGNDFVVQVEGGDGGLGIGIARMHVPGSAIHVFDAASGRRIGPAASAPRAT